MKNKIVSFLFVLLTSSSLIGPVYGQPMTYCSPDWGGDFSSQDYDDWDQHDAYRYVSVGVGPIIFIPNIGIGYRERYAQFGWDGAVSFSTIGYAHQVSAHLVRHFYLNPSERNSSYFGLGVLGSGVFTNDREGGCTLSPNFVFGKGIEGRGDSRHFIEMHLAIPSFWVGTGGTSSMYFPLMYIKYGIAF